MWNRSENRQAASVQSSLESSRRITLSRNHLDQNQTQAVNPVPCWQCGGMYFVRDCSFSNHVCSRDCKQTGHKEGYCGCYTAKTSSKSKKISKVNDVFAIHQVSSEFRRKVLTVKIHGYGAKLQFDTASDITIISRKRWSENLGSPQLISTTPEATTASGQPLKLLGELSRTLTLGGIT